MKRKGVDGQGYSYKTLFIFKMGDVIEKQIIEWLGKKIDILARWVRVYVPEFGAAGTADALAIDHQTHELFPIEVKSTRDKALAYRVPYPNHEQQAGAYALFMKLARTLLVYQGRDGAKILLWVPATEALKNKISKQWNTLNDYWNKIPEDKKTYDELEPFLPPRLDKIQAKREDGSPFVYEKDGPWGKAGTPKIELDPECTYCKYMNLCWKEER